MAERVTEGVTAGVLRQQLLAVAHQAELLLPTEPPVESRRAWVDLVQNLKALSRMVADLLYLEARRAPLWEQAEWIAEHVDEIGLQADEAPVPVPCWRLRALRDALAPPPSTEGGEGAGGG